VSALSLLAQKAKGAEFIDGNPTAKRRSSVGVLIMQQDPNRAPYDSQVECEGPVAYVMEVKLDPVAYILRGVECSPAAVYLRPPCQSRLHSLSYPVCRRCLIQR